MQTRSFVLAASASVLVACAVPSSAPAPVPSLAKDDGFADRLANVAMARHTAPAGSLCSSDHGLFRCFARGRVDANGHRIHGVPDASGVAGLGADDLAAAYKIPVDNDPGATVAIVDAFGYSNLEADLAMYRSQYGLPACTAANGCLKIVDENGGSNLPQDDVEWIGETSLDVDMASAACPKCKILVVQASDQDSSLFTSIKTAAMLGATVISNSWGAPEQEIQEAFQISVADAEPFLQHDGIGVFVATGDDGFDDGDFGPDYPGTSAFSVGVGGTSLSPDASTRGWSEAAWDDGGSACSVNIAKPTWQTGSDCPMRMTADVSAVGDPETGVAVYDSDDGGWEVVGGTSAASPLTAAIYAVTRNGNRTAQFAYQNPTAYFDVTTGNNGNFTDCGAKLCDAGSGWDGPTGVGTPNGTALAALGGTGSGSGSGSGSNMGSGSDMGSDMGSNMGSGSDMNGDNNGGNGNSGGGGCAVGGGSGLATFVFALGLALVRRRRA